MLEGMLKDCEQCKCRLGTLLASNHCKGWAHSAVLMHQHHMACTSSPSTEPSAPGACSTPAQQCHQLPARAAEPGG